MKVLFHAITALTYLNLSAHSSDWTREYNLIDGLKITRTANAITLDQTTTENTGDEDSPFLFNSENTAKTICYQALNIAPGACLTSHTILNNHLSIDLTLSEDQFTRALIDSELYTPTEEEMTLYTAIAEWTKKVVLTNCTITHSPVRITLHIKATGKSTSSKNHRIKDILFRTHSTEEEFEANIQKLKELGL